MLLLFHGRYCAQTDDLQCTRRNVSFYAGCKRAMRRRCDFATTARPRTFMQFLRPYGHGLNLFRALNALQITPPLNITISLCRKLDARGRRRITKERREKWHRAIFNEITFCFRRSSRSNVLLVKIMIENDCKIIELPTKLKGKMYGARGERQILF